MSLMSESNWWQLFHKEVKRLYNLFFFFSFFDNFKLRLESGVFRYISWLTVHFFGTMMGFSEKESEQQSNGTNVAS